MKPVGQTLTNLSDLRYVTVRYSIDGIQRSESVAPKDSIDLPVRALVHSMNYQDGLPATVSLVDRYIDEDEI